MSLSVVRQVAENGQKSEKTSFGGGGGGCGGGLPLLHGELAAVFFISSRGRRGVKEEVKLPSLAPSRRHRSLPHLCCVLLISRLVTRPETRARSPWVVEKMDKNDPVSPSCLSGAKKSDRVTHLYALEFLYGFLLYISPSKSGGLSFSPPRFSVRQTAWP